MGSVIGLADLETALWIAVGVFFAASVAVGLVWQALWQRNLIGARTPRA